MRTRAERRYAREVKAWRRIKEDRAQHGSDRDCPCWGDEDPRVWGRIFARFADTPKACSCWMCGNPRRYGSSWRLTLAERAADYELYEQLVECRLEHVVFPVRPADRAAEVDI